MKKFSLKWIPILLLVIMIGLLAVKPDHDQQVALAKTRHAFNTHVFVGSSSVEDVKHFLITNRIEFGYYNQYKQESTIQAIQRDTSHAILSNGNIQIKILFRNGVVNTVDIPSVYS